MYPSQHPNKFEYPPGLPLPGSTVSAENAMFGGASYYVKLYIEYFTQLTTTVDHAYQDNFSTLVASHKSQALSFE